MNAYFTGFDANNANYTSIPDIDVYVCRVFAGSYSFVRAVLGPSFGPSEDLDQSEWSLDPNHKRGIACGDVSRDQESRAIRILNIKVRVIA